MEHQMHPKSETIMCGDHPNFQQKEPSKAKLSTNGIDNKHSNNTYLKMEPSTSRMVNATSEPLIENRRRVRSLELVNGQDVDAMLPGNRNFLKAALGSSRWPPYLLCVWVVVLLLTHALHCVVALLDRALPAFKKTCVFLRNWTEDSWKTNPDKDLNAKLTAIGLSLLTALLYTLYFALYSVYAIAVWSVEPLCTENEEIKESNNGGEAKITNYSDDIGMDCFSK